MIVAVEIFFRFINATEWMTPETAIYLSCVGSPPFAKYPFRRRGIFLRRLGARMNTSALLLRVILSLFCLRLETSLGFTVPSSSTSTPRYTTTATPSSTEPLGDPICVYHQVTIPTSQSGPPRQAVAVEDLTPVLSDLLMDSGLKQGTVTVISRHTTTAITINERESRLARDIEQTLLQLIPPDERSSAAIAKAGVRYLHNDIDKRPESDEEAQRCRDNGWNIDDPEELQKWRDQEPINAHSHLLSMMLGSSESIPVVNGAMVIGQWQSILLVDLDGPRDRTVGIQLMGYQ